MKTIGLLGGMSWESTASYYRAINEGVKTQLGGLHSAKVAMFSVDFHEIEQLQHLGQWQDTAQILAEHALGVQAAGADCLLICTNTMHKVADEVASALSIPLLHIADATAERLVADGVSRVGLLGTRFTMEEDFYKGRLKDLYGLHVLVPDSTQQEFIHDVIYQELCSGVIKESSRRGFLDIIHDLHREGAEAVILGCTEIALLVNQTHTHLPLYDTTQIHAEAAVQFALK